jgi:hypothetical protein
VLSLYERDPESSSRSIPVRFELAPVVKKPGIKASQEKWQEYWRQKKKNNLSVQFVGMVKEMGHYLKATGHLEKRAPIVTDASFCNRTVMTEDWEEQNVSMTARTRKDIVLCKRATGQGRPFYGKTKFTREQVRRRDWIAPWRTTLIFHGGCFREVRYKEPSGVYWQGGAKIRYGIRTRSAKCRRCWWPCIAGYYWQACIVAAPNAPRSMNPCPNGDEEPSDSRVWTWSRCCESN